VTVNTLPNRRAVPPATAGVGVRAPVTPRANACADGPSSFTTKLHWRSHARSGVVAGAAPADGCCWHGVFSRQLYARRHRWTLSRLSMKKCRQGAQVCQPPDVFFCVPLVPFSLNGRPCRPDKPGRRHETDGAAKRPRGLDFDALCRMHGYIMVFYGCMGKPSYHAAGRLNSSLPFLYTVLD
jgi:hypothetical protein